MSDHIHKAIDELVGSLQEKEKAVRETKLAVNQLCRLIGQAERYAIDDPTAPQNFGTIQPDQFYGRPMATVVREYLEMRKGSGKGAAPFSDIFSALLAGGYEFDTKNEESSKASLRSAIQKKPVFHRLPNGFYGLTTWYPKAKKDKPDAENGGANGGAASAEAAAPAAPKPDEE